MDVSYDICPTSVILRLYEELVRRLSFYRVYILVYSGISVVSPGSLSLSFSP